MNRTHTRLDPRWQEFAASLRDGQLFIKMPASKARALLLVWEILSQRVKATSETKSAVAALLQLLHEELTGTLEYGIKSVFYAVPTALCQKDIEVLRHYEGEDATGVFAAFRETLERGLRNEPAVDWIERVGGPKREALAGLEREDSEPVDLSVFDFEDTDFVL